MVGQGRVRTLLSLSARRAQRLEEALQVDKALREQNQHQAATIERLIKRDLLWQSLVVGLLYNLAQERWVADQALVDENADNPQVMGIE